MTIDIDTAGIAAAMLLSFTTLGAASWAMLERARAAGYQRAARRQEARRTVAALQPRRHLLRTRAPAIGRSPAQRSALVGDADWPKPWGAS